MAIAPILLDFPEQIESARLTIRSPRAGDGPMMYEAVCESLVELRRFPASMLWAMREPSLAQCEQYCRESHANFLARRDLPFLLLRKDSGVMVGASGLHRMDWRVPRLEVGFWGRTALQRNGFMTEGVGAIVDFAFAALGARRVEAFPDAANERSCGLCERLGFTLEGTLRQERVDPDGVLRDTRVYARIA